MLIGVFHNRLKEIFVGAAILDVRIDLDFRKNGAIHAHVDEHDIGLENFSRLGNGEGIAPFVQGETEKARKIEDDLRNLRHVMAVGDPVNAIERVEEKMLVELILNVFELKFVFEDAGFIVFVNELFNALQKNVELIANHAEFVGAGHRNTYGKIAAFRGLDGTAQYVNGTKDAVQQKYQNRNKNQ